MMENSIYKTDHSKFNRGISQNSTRANTLLKSRQAARTTSMMDNYNTITPRNEMTTNSKSDNNIEAMNKTIS